MTLAIWSAVSQTFISFPTSFFALVLMTTSNIERFDDITGQVFATLYENFPVPCSIGAVKMLAGGERACRDASGFTGAELSEEAVFIMATIQWLVDSGYVRCESRADICFYDSVLTAKGLEVLKAVPGQLAGDKPLGEKLVSAVKTESATALRGLVQQALALGFKFLMHT